MTVVEMLNKSRLCIGRPQVCYLLQTAHPAKSRRCRMSLALLDGVIGRQQSAIGMVPNRRKPGLSSVERATSAAPPRPTEHTMIEAAIQLDLITPSRPRRWSRTLREWLMEKKLSGRGQQKPTKEAGCIGGARASPLQYRSVGEFRMDRTAGLEVAVTHRSWLNAHAPAPRPTLFDRNQRRRRFSRVPCGCRRPRRLPGSRVEPS